MIKISLVEDDVQLALMVQEQLNASKILNCKHVYHNAEDALFFIPSHKPDIVVADIGLPNQSGIVLVEKLSSKMHSMEFCMFTSFQQEDKIFQSIKAGAKGYLLKSDKIEEIEKGLVELYNGGSPMSPLIARKVIQYFSRISISEMNYLLDDLSKRENEILLLLSKGLLYKEIAQELSIALGTVKQHIHKIYRKLQVNNRTEAINILSSSK